MMKPRIKNGLRFVLTLTLVLLLSFCIFAENEAEDNGTSETATNLPVNTEITGSISSPSDVDYYRFSVEKTGKISISLTFDTALDENLYWKVTLSLGNGADYLFGETSSFYVSGTSFLTTPETGILPNYDFYIKVETAGGDLYSNQNYHLKINFTEEENREAEPNQFKEIPHYLKLNQTVIGNLFTETDIDYYCFNLTEETDLRVRFDRTNVPDGTSCWTMFIVSEDGSFSGKANVTGGQVYFVKCGTMKPGVYYLGLQKNETLITEPYSFTIIGTHEHDFGDWIISKQATCTEEGLETTQCMICGETQERPIPVTEHVYGDWQIISEATCTADGEQIHRCQECGAYESEIIPAAGHSYGEWKISLQAGCETDGEMKRICNVCGDMIVDVIPSTGHQYSEWEKVSDPTCSVCGRQVRQCGNCGELDETTIPMTEHNFKEKGRVEGNGLTNPLIKARVCTECGFIETYEAEGIWMALVWILLGAFAVLSGITVLVIILIVKKAKKKKQQK